MDCALVLWSYKTAFGALVAATELAAFAVAFDLDFSAAWAEEFCGVGAWRDGFAAACACG